MPTQLWLPGFEPEEDEPMHECEECGAVCPDEFCRSCVAYWQEIDNRIKERKEDEAV